MPSNTKHLGTSDVIESVFTKYKHFSARTPLKGVGKALLTLPVITGTIALPKIAAALTNTNVTKVNDWLKQNIGTSLFAMRLEAFNTQRANNSSGDPSGSSHHDICEQPAQM